MITFSSIYFLICAILISLLANLYLIIWVKSIDKCYNENIKILSKFQNDVYKELTQQVNSIKDVESTHKDISINMIKLMYHRAKEIEDYEFLKKVKKMMPKNFDYYKFD